MHMVWIWLALATAIGETIRDLCLRSLLKRSSWTILQVIGLSSALAAFLLLPLALSQQQSIIWPDFLLAMSLGGGLNALAFWNYGRAIAKEDLSLVLPLINLSPLVLLLSGWLVLGERPGLSAIVGVALLVTGALLLADHSQQARFSLNGLREIWASAGCRAMLLVALLWGIAASIDKLGIEASNSFVWGMSLQGLIATSLLSLDLKRSNSPASRTLRPTSGSAALTLLLAACAGAAGTVMQMEAIQQTEVVNVVAIKRLSTLFGSGVGVFALGEPNALGRLTAASLMVLGAVTVMLGSLN